MDNKTELEKAAKEARNAYFRKWRSENKEKVREYNQNYWLRKAKQMDQESRKGGK